MSILLFLIVALAMALTVRWFLFWTFPEMPEDISSSHPSQSDPSSFYDPRTWMIFQTKPLISYRRDKRGRFRKMP